MLKILGSKPLKWETAKAIDELSIPALALTEAKPVDQPVGG